MALNPISRAKAEIDAALPHPIRNVKNKTAKFQAAVSRFWNSDAMRVARPDGQLRQMINDAATLDQYEILAPRVERFVNKNRAKWPPAILARWEEYLEGIKTDLKNNKRSV